MKGILDAYLHLSEYINANVLDQSGNPIFKHIDLWNEQTEYKDDPSQKDEEYPFSFPALFIDFDVPNTMTIGLYEQNLDTNVTFYIVDNTVSDTHRGAVNQAKATKILELCVSLHEVLQGYANQMSGNMDRSRAGRYKTRSVLKVYSMSYRALLRDHSPTEARRATETRTIDVEIGVTKRPHLNPNNTPSGDEFFDLN